MFFFYYYNITFLKIKSVIKLNLIEELLENVFDLKRFSASHFFLSKSI